MRFLIAVALLWSAGAMAAPFLVADVPSPNETTDRCVYTINAGTAQEVPVAVDTTIGLAVNGYKICKIDLSAAPTGQNAMTLAVKSTLWGATSAAVPFSFVRPGLILDPATLRLVP